MSEWVLLLIVALPLLALWIRSIVEVARRSDYSGTQRLVWLLILVLVPIVGLAVYVVARTPRARVSGGNSDSGRAERLVLLAERRQRGEVDDAEYGATVAAFRHR